MKQNVTNRGKDLQIMIYRDVSTIDLRLPCVKGAVTDR